nr:hypothetical protein [Agrobacterium fabrum]
MANFISIPGRQDFRLGKRHSSRPVRPVDTLSFHLCAVGLALLGRCRHRRPRHPLAVDVTLAAYDRVLSDRMFWVAYGNTFIYTFGGTLMSLLIMIPGAYALSRKRLRGRTFFNIAIAFTLWFNAGMIRSS